MAKNMNAFGFRKLDIDALAEDQYKEDDETAESPCLGPDESEVCADLFAVLRNRPQISHCLNANNLTGAVDAALRNAPVAKGASITVRQRAAYNMCRVLQAHKAADIDRTLERLDREQTDLLLK